MRKSNSTITTLRNSSLRSLQVDLRDTVQSNPIHRPVHIYTGHPGHPGYPSFLIEQKSICDDVRCHDGRQFVNRGHCRHGGYGGHRGELGHLCTFEPAGTIGTSAPANERPCDLLVTHRKRHGRAATRPHPANPKQAEEEEEQEGQEGQEEEETANGGLNVCMYVVPVFDGIAIIPLLPPFSLPQPSLTRTC